MNRVRHSRISSIFLIVLLFVPICGVAAAEGVATANQKCSSEDSQGALRNALTHTKHPDKTISDMVVDFDHTTWSFENFIPLKKDGFVLTCEATASVELPINEELEPNMKSAIAKEGFTSFHAEAIVSYDVLVSEKSEILVRLLYVQYRNNTADIFAASLIFGHRTDGELNKRYNEMHPDQNKVMPSSGRESLR